MSLFAVDGGWQEPTLEEEAAAIIAATAAAAAPPPDLMVSQWADSKRILPQSSGARGARWNTDAVPPLRGIMDSVHEIGVSVIALEKASQTGGSEAIHNICGYFMEHDPCAMLFVHPTAGVADEWSKERLGDMLRTTPSLRSVVQDKRQPRGSYEAESTLSLKMFPGGYLAIGGANTPNTFARRAVRVAFGDDVDRFPPVVGEEGDPAELLKNRTESYLNPLVVFVSTPTLKNGRIDTLYQRSDQRRFFMPCPNCGRWDYITWNDERHFRVAFDDNDPDTARLQCPDEDHEGCGIPLFERDRREMLSAGEWRPTAVPQEAGLVGFHLPAMLATIGKRTLSVLVEKWLAARKIGKSALRVFINTQLAEGWEDRTEKMDPHGLMARRESYGDGIEVPAKAVALTAGVDVQGDRFEMKVTGFGLGGERWLVDYRVIPGDPKKHETREELFKALCRRYAHASGHQLPIHATCIDTGYATEEMYDFVLKYQAKRIYATKGFAGRQGTPIVGHPSEKRYGRAPRPVRLYPINTDDAKTHVVDSLALVDHGPGSMHFPSHLDTVDEEYFAGLCSEHKETRYNKSGVATHIVWVQDRERNEPFDLAVLCLAAFKLLNPNIKQMAEMIAATPVPTEDVPSKAQKPGSEPAAPAKAQPPRPRVTRSTYVENNS